MKVWDPLRKKEVALTPEEKMVFPDVFASFEDYQAWYESVCP